MVVGNRRISNGALSRRRLLSRYCYGCSGPCASGSGLRREPWKFPAPAKTPPEPLTSRNRAAYISYAGGAAGSYDTQGRTFDPKIQTQFGSKSYTLFYERLLAYNLVNYKVEPELAQKWEQPSPTEYSFTCSRASSGRTSRRSTAVPLTADDVVCSLERARTNDPRFLSRSLLTLVDKIEAPRPTTIRITTKGPDASTLVQAGRRRSWRSCRREVYREVSRSRPRPRRPSAPAPS